MTIWNLAENRVVASLAIERETNLKDRATQLQWQPDYTVQLIPDDNRLSASQIYSPDGRFFFETYYESPGVYEADTYALLHPLELNFAYTLSFSHDGRFLTVIQYEFPAYLLDTTTWETVLTFDTHATAAAFSPDNTWLACASMGPAPSLCCD